MTKPAELRAVEDAELLTRLAEAKQELFNLRFQVATGQLDNNARIGHVRKDIARIQTLLREREIIAYEASLVAGADVPQPGAGTAAEASNGGTT